MKTIAVLDADLEVTPLGTRSRLADDLAGTPTLRRTVERLARCTQLAGITVVCPDAQVSQVRQIVNGLPVHIRPRGESAPPYRNLVRTARKWSLDGWRGGLGGSTALDEYADPNVCAALGAETGADALAVVPPGSALLDPTLTDSMVTHASTHAEDSRLTFAQAPPGLLPTIFKTALCAQLAERNVPAGWALAYKPDDPSVDLVFRPCNFPVPQAVRYATGRLTADTSRSWRTLQRLLADGEAPDAASISRRAMDDFDLDPGSMPREVEIELTTDDPLPHTVLRPRGGRVPARGPLSPELVARLAAELASADDDALVVLGGFGDPLAHDRFGETLRALRTTGVYGITVCTTGHRLTDAAIAAILEHRVDVVVFLLDAWHDATYARVHGGATLAPAREAVARLASARERAGQVEPIIVPQLTKSTLNVEEMDVFFDGWMRAQGCATIVGFSHFSRRMPDLTVVEMAPPRRTPCRQILRRCLLLADGRIVACDQDFAANMVLGNLAGQSLGEIWTGPAAQALRARHLAVSRDTKPLRDVPLCADCREWHRP